MSQNPIADCHISEKRKEVLPIFNRFKQKDAPIISAHDFQSLFEQFYPFVVKHVYFLTQDKVMAEDIAQETFIKLYHSCPISLFNPGAWLNRVATNLTYNLLKGERMRRDREGLQSKERPANPETSEDLILRKEETDYVKSALNALPVKERMCLLLRHSGFSYEEISEALNIPKSSVGQTIARTQAKFKEIYLKGKGGGFNGML